MGQLVVLKFIEKNPRLSTKEIACFLDINVNNVARFISRLVKTKYLKSDEPTDDEFKRIVDKFPTCVTGRGMIKVYEVNDE